MNKRVEYTISETLIVEVRGYLMLVIDIKYMI